MVYECLPHPIMDISIKIFTILKSWDSSISQNITTQCYGVRPLMNEARGKGGINLLDFMVLRAVPTTA